jgi:hypothetical protein
MRNAHKILVGKPEREKLLGRPTRGCENHIKMEVKKIECDVSDRIHLVQDGVQWGTLVNTVMNLRIA